jgi:hypothetical protein
VGWRHLFGVGPTESKTLCLSGQTTAGAWCFHLLAPVDFEQSFRLSVGSASALALFYAP